ncbi:hypothetical protein AAMO2058_001502700 [Amorphochlora amoebiformis]
MRIPTNPRVLLISKKSPRSPILSTKPHEDHRTTDRHDGHAAPAGPLRRGGKDFQRPSARDKDENDGKGCGIWLEIGLRRVRTRRRLVWDDSGVPR